MFIFISETVKPPTGFFSFFFSFKNVSWRKRGLFWRECVSRWWLVVVHTNPLPSGFRRVAWCRREPLCVRHLFSSRRSTLCKQTPTHTHTHKSLASFGGSFDRKRSSIVIVIGFCTSRWWYLRRKEESSLFLPFFSNTHSNTGPITISHHGGGSAPTIVYYIQFSPHVGGCVTRVQYYCRTLSIEECRDEIFVIIHPWFLWHFRRRIKKREMSFLFLLLLLSDDEQRGAAGWKRMSTEFHLAVG